MKYFYLIHSMPPQTSFFFIATYLPYSRNPLENYSQQSLIGFFVMVFYITIRLVYLNLDINIKDKEYLIVDVHIFYLLNMVLFCIILPLYYINQVSQCLCYQIGIYFRLCGSWRARFLPHINLLWSA